MRENNDGINAVSGRVERFFVPEDGRVRVVVVLDAETPTELNRVICLDDRGARIAIARLRAKDYGQLAKGLYQSGVLTLPVVASALGSDDEYQRWTRQQPCILTKREGVQFAHVRRAHNSGTGYKPMYSGIPLSPEAHRLQHQKGELECLRHYGRPVSDVDSAKDWFNRACAHNLRLWSWNKLRTSLGVDSMRDATPAQVVNWFDSHDLRALIPKAYREAV